MALGMNYSDTMTHSKYSMVSVSSTCAGDSSSEDSMSLSNEMYSTQQEFSAQFGTPSRSSQTREHLHLSSSNTFGLDRSEMPSTRESSPEPFHYTDHSDMPSTREPSPEPYWNNANLYKWNDPSVESLWRAHRGLNNDHVPQRNLPRRSSCEPVLMQHEDVNPPAQRLQTVLLVPHNQPVLFVQSDQDGNVILPMTANQPVSLPLQTTPTLAAQPTPVPSSNMIATPEPEQEQTAPTKSSPKTKDRRHTKGDTMLNKMSAQQKEALCKYVFDLMVQKGFTNQEGYLIVDIFSEVWKDMWEDIDDSAEGWRAAKHRFGELLHSAPQYFRLFRKGIRVANQCGWFARKGEKMVRLNLDHEK
jgi:hypothetical protein